MDETSLVINMDDYAARMSLYIYLEWQYHKTNYSKSVGPFQPKNIFNTVSETSTWSKKEDYREIVRNSQHWL